MGHTCAFLYLLFLLLEGSFCRPQTNGALLPYRGLGNTSTGVPFRPSQFENFEIVNIYPHDLTEIASAAEIAHLYLSVIRQMWCSNERQFTYERFQDDKISGSFLELTTERDVSLTTQEVGWSAIFALESMLLSQRFDTTYVAIAEAAIYRRRPQERLGALEPSISSRSSSDAANPINGSSPTPLAQGFATQKLSSRQSDQKSPNPSSTILGDSAFDVEVIIGREILPQRTILALFTDVLRGHIWNRFNGSYLSDSFLPGTAFGLKRDNCTMFTFLERLEVGEKKVTFGDVEQVFRALAIFPSVKWAPSALEVRAYLLSASGQRLGDPYLRVLVDLSKHLQSANGSTQVIWQGEQSDKGLVASAKS